MPTFHAIDCALCCAVSAMRAGGMERNHTSSIALEAIVRR